MGRGAVALALAALVFLAVATLHRWVMVGSQSVRVVVVELGLGLAAGPVTAASNAPTPAASAGDTDRTARARHPVLLMNPRSGGGKVERFGLVDLCRQADEQHRVPVQAGTDRGDGRRERVPRVTRKGMH